MRFIPLLVCILTAACAQTTTSGVAFGVADKPDGAQQAYFDAFPEELFARAQQGCDGPGQNLVQPRLGQVNCESLPDPQTAAALILQFDGTVEDLPTFVISLSGQTDAAGYLVTADSFIRVPNRDGGVQQVRFPDLAAADTFRDLFINAGGRPL